MCITVSLGDITNLKAECIVNASNATGLGCFTPNHPCIDNAIHRVAGPGLLRECRLLGGIPVGTAAITNGYKLPAKYIIHATGPQRGRDGFEDHLALKKTYQSILELAEQNGITEIAFCLISAGMYAFDKRNALKTQMDTIYNWRITNKYSGKVDIIVNAFTEEEFDLYKEYYRMHRPQVQYKMLLPLSSQTTSSPGIEYY